MSFSTNKEKERTSVHNNNKAVCETVFHFQCKDRLCISCDSVVVACMPKNVVTTRFVDKGKIIGKKNRQAPGHSCLQTPLPDLI